VLQVAIELHPQTECTAEPWESYFAARFAWANEAAELHRGLNQTRQPATAKRLEAPQYLEITDGDQHTTILTCGLPFHRREGGRMLDTLLLVPGERCREFQFGLGFDLKQPQQDADGLLAPPILLAQTAPPPAPSSSSWLFHIDTRNVLATHWEPLVSNGGVTGFRVRLLEIAGRSAQAHLSAFRPVVSARQVNFQGHTLASCTLAEGRVQVQMGAHEWQEIEAVW
jgi:alpha-mannosidase